METPLVSIILRTYKRSNQLKQCIKNIIAQEYKNWELIIVDDNGLDSIFSGDAKKIAISFKNISNKIHVIEHDKNLGLCAAGNTGIENSKGKFIAFIDDDDNWDSKKLKYQIEEIVKSNVGIVICGLNYIDLENNTSEKIVFNFGNDLFKSILKKGSGVNTSALLFRKEILEKINGFDRNGLVSYTDFDLLVRASQISKFKELKKPLVNYYVDNKGISRNYNAKFKGKLKVLKKYKSFYKKYNLMYFYGKHLEVLADYALLQNHKKEAIKTYIKSLFISPFVFKRYLKIIITLLGGKNLYINLLKNRINKNKP